MTIDNPKAAPQKKMGDVTIKKIFLYVFLSILLIILWGALQLSGILIARVLYFLPFALGLFASLAPLPFLLCAMGPTFYLFFDFALIKELSKLKSTILSLFAVAIFIVNSISYALLVASTERLTSASQFSTNGSPISLDQIPSSMERGFNEFSYVFGAEYLLEREEDTPGLRVFYGTGEGRNTMYVLLLPLVPYNFDRTRDKVRIFVAHYSFIPRVASENESRSQALEEITDFPGYLYFPPTGVPNENIARGLAEATGLGDPNGFMVARILTSDSVFTTGYTLLTFAIIFSIISFCCIVFTSLFFIVSLALHLLSDWKESRDASNVNSESTKFDFT